MFVDCLTCENILRNKINVFYLSILSNSFELMFNVHYFCVVLLS